MVVRKYTLMLLSVNDLSHSVQQSMLARALSSLGAVCAGVCVRVRVDVLACGLVSAHNLLSGTWQHLETRSGAASRSSPAQYGSRGCNDTWT